MNENYFDCTKSMKLLSGVKPKLGLYCWSRWLSLPLFIVAFFMMTYTASAQLVYQGVVPVQSPKGGFAVDGNAYANHLTDGVGDWFYVVSTHPGLGEGLIGIDGFPLDSTMTTFYRDSLSGDPDYSIFLEKSKINENPITYNIGQGNVPNKNEIQNVGVHFTWGDPDVTGVGEGGDPFYSFATDLWCLFAADREVTNGSSYIDFEFLQKTLTLNGDGTFTTIGLDGGRTVNDLLVTVELTN
ncbi:MAG: hypothetical protein GQ525_03655, partial [Draconibacterium sp.]|nr:hypothetical protein [Draconibacterium sp.]